MSRWGRMAGWRTGTMAGQALCLLLVTMVQSVGSRYQRHLHNNSNGGFTHGYHNSQDHNRQWDKQQEAYRETGVELGGVNYTWGLQNHRAWLVQEYPNPLTNPVLCGRTHPSYVCDPDRALTKHEVSQLDEGIRRICHDTWCSCKTNCSHTCKGFNVAVAIVGKMKFPRDPTLGTGPSKEVKQTTIKNWARYLRTTGWKFGTCNNDVVIVFAKEDQMLYSSIGHSARHKLNKECAESVYSDALPHLHAGNYAQALSQMLRDYRFVFLDDFKCVIHTIDILPTGNVIGIIFGVVCIPVMLCVVLVFLGPCFRGRGFGGKRHQWRICGYVIYDSDRGNN